MTNLCYNKGTTYPKERMTMKKFLSLLLLAALLFSLIACNEDVYTPDDDDDDEEEIADTNQSNQSDLFNDQKWNNLLNKDKFQNVTVLCESIFLSGYSDYDEDEPVQTNLIKVNGEQCSLNGEIPDDPNTIVSVRSVFVDLALDLIGNFEAFTYNKETNTFIANRTLTGTATVSGYTAAITCESVRVTLDEDNALAKITCKMTQDIEAGEESTVFVLDVTFTYSNYGTTVVE